MTFGGYEAFEDPYTYPGTAVLRNRPGIRDPAKFQAFETEVSTFRAGQALPNGKLGAAHYRRIHRHLFQDVYTWAGRYRTVRIEKNGNMFCFPENITSEMDRVFRQLRERTFLRTTDERGFVDGAAEFISEINAIHPFREGNGRTQLAFLDLLAERAGHPLRLERLERDTWLQAIIASFAGDLEPLRREIAALRASE